MLHSYFLSLILLLSCYDLILSRSHMWSIFDCQEPQALLTTRAWIFIILIIGFAMSHKCPLSREPRAANRISACGALSNYLHKRTLCRMIYVVLYYVVPAPLNSWEKASWKITLSLSFCTTILQYNQVTLVMLMCFRVIERILISIVKISDQHIIDNIFFRKYQ